jgi:hypothetical protein
MERARSCKGPNDLSSKNPCLIKVSIWLSAPLALPDREINYSGRNVKDEGLLSKQDGVSMRFSLGRHALAIAGYIFLC